MTLPDILSIIAGVVTAAVGVLAVLAYYLGMRQMDEERGDFL